ncbi:ComEC/Rec2 family competence protein [Curtobacterium sp. RRHDQ10]|uniref:ComEC/Rec2 family competence protein n=1 Tax=Curtobacterium phyllosphaerae TaxID=3413379 RepID=UPI003BF08880
MRRARSGPDADAAGIASAVIAAVAGVRPGRGTDLRLVVPVGCMWVTAAVLVGVPGTVAWWTALTAGVVTLIGTVVLLVARSSLAAGCSVALLAVALVALVALAVGVGAGTRAPAELDRAASRPRIGATVRVAHDVAPSDRSFPAELTALSGGGATTDGVHVPIRVVATGLRLAAGSTAHVDGRLQAEPADGTAAFVLFVRGHPGRVDPPGPLGVATHRARTAFAAVTRSLPEPGAGLLRGLAIGDRSDLDEQTSGAMETTALTHLTAVSGSNCAVLVGLVVLAGRGVRAPRSVRAVGAISVLVGFVLLVGPDPSIVRAAVMATIVLVVDVVGRPVRGAPLIAVAVLVMLVWDPWYARSFAFVLSVLATAGIVVVAPPLTALLARRLWTPVAALVAVPIAAQTACWPVTVLLAPVIPTYAVPANLVSEPLAPVGTVIGLGACLLAPSWPGGASVLAAVAWVPATAIAGIAGWFASLPFANVPWPDGVAGAVDATLLCGGIVVAALLRRRPVRAVVVAGVTVVAVVGVGVVVVPAAVLRASLPAAWGVAACDVGQGDAVFVRDADAVLLVDTGDDEDRLRSCLDLLGIDRIDVLVASHFDRDHVGAVGAVAHLVDVALVGPEGRSEDDRIVSTLQRAGADVQRASAGTSGTLGRLAWRILWPPPGTRTGGNDASLVLAVRPGPGPRCAGCLSGLFLGDLGERSQALLVRSVAAADLGPVDVVKVAHHGSADQDPALYRLVQARVGIVSVGADNNYGHPTASALEMLAAAGTTAVRTDLGGTTVLVAGPDDVLVWQERGGGPGASAHARTLVPGVGRRRARRTMSGAGTERNRWRSRERPARRPRSTRCRGPGSGRRRWCS